MRNRVVGNLKNILKEYERKLVQKGAIGKKRYMRIVIKDDEAVAVRQRVASYLGHFKHADAYNLTVKIFEKFGYLNALFSLDEQEGMLVTRISPDFEPDNMRNQYQWFVKRYAEYCIFFQVGRFIEFFEKQAERFAPFFNLKIVKGRRGFKSGCGFPVSLLKVFKRKALVMGQSYIVVAEHGYHASGLKKRVITENLILERKWL